MSTETGHAPGSNFNEQGGNVHRIGGTLDIQTGGKLTVNDVDVTAGLAKLTSIGALVASGTQAANITAPTLTGTASVPATTAIGTADGSDAASTQALANATKAKVNTLITDVAAIASDITDLYASLTSTNAKLNAALAALDAFNITA